MILYLFLTLALGVISGWGLLILLPILFHSERLANLYANVAMKIGKRTALVLTRSGELKWQRMKDTDSGSQEVSVNGNSVTLSDSDRSILPFYDKPFAIADSVYGVIFTPIHAALGTGKQRLVARNNYTIEADKQVRQDKRILGWIQDRVFVPLSECIDLRDVRALATGRERGTDPEKGWTFYKFLKQDGSNGMALLKALVPIGVYVVLVILFWQILSGGSSGTATGNSPNPTNGTTISVIAFGLSSVPHRKKIGVLALSIAIVIIGLGTFPLYTILGILFFIMWIIGVAIGIGAFLILGVMIGGLGFGGATSGIMFSSALWLLDSPTIIQDEREYRLIDRKLDGPTFKHGRHGIQFAFTERAIRNFDGYLCDTSEYDMPESVVKNELQERGKVRTAEGLADEPKVNGYYVSMAKTLSCLSQSYVGKETDKKIQNAKQEFGDGVSGMSIRMTMLTSMGSIFLAILTAVVFFG